MNKLQRTLKKVLRLNEIKYFCFVNIDGNDYTNKYINNILKKNQFVEIGKNEYLNGFTHIKLDIGNEKEYISVHIKHDIDNIVNKKIVGLKIQNKLTNLQFIIDYFNEI